MAARTMAETEGTGPASGAGASPVAAGGELAWLNEQAGAVRAEIERMRLDLQAAARDIDRDRVPLLLAANEQLVLAALRAQVVAEIALKDLAAVAGQPPAAGGEKPRFGDAQHLAIVAHELRSPLVPIRAAASLLKRAHADEKLLARLQAMIEQGVAHMSSLVEDLLDVERAATGKFRLVRRPVDLTAILMFAVESCRPAMESRLQHLKTVLAPEPFIVWGDPVRLTQIFSNLLENASKYTQPGGHITLSVVVQEGSVSISVLDDGTGMDEAHLLRVFDLFDQGNRGAQPDNQGLGIGLAVVRELVEAHGGSVVARSAGKSLGSELVVTLPLRAHDAQP